MIRLALLVTLVAVLSVFGAQPAAHAQTVACVNGAGHDVGMAWRTLESGGETRRYLLYVPTGYDPTRATPLVLSMHGFASNPAQQAAFARWEQWAEAKNLLVVYPEGTGFPRRWNTGRFLLAEQAEAAGALISNVDDVAFFHDLLNALEAEFCIDTARVFATGLSNGGGMSYLLACEMAERITAVGLVAAALVQPIENCAPARPVAAVLVHGIEDTIVPYDGSASMRLPAIETWTAAYAALMSCEALPSRALIAPTVTVSAYQGCAAPVTLYTISDGGHTWAGGLELPRFIVGNTSTAIDATDVIWTFFESL